MKIELTRQEVLKLIIDLKFSLLVYKGFGKNKKIIDSNIKLVKKLKRIYLKNKKLVN